MDRVDAGRIARSVAGHPYRRILLSVLDSRTAPVTLHDLSRAVLALDRSGGSRVVGREPPAFDDESAREAVETMAAQLHHVHLPRLVSAGLVVYDACDSVVTDWSHPAVGDRWLTAPPIDRLATVIADDRVQSMHAD